MNAPSIVFGRDGRFRTLETELSVPRDREEVFRFFADAFNLEAITPPSIRFDILTPDPIAMRVGARIDYRLRLNGIPLRWQSEITAWEPPHRFVDEQRRGPYQAWIHAHTFEERDGATLVTDRVHYAVPGGSLVDLLFIQPRLRRIFAYRQSKLAEILG